LTAHPLRSGDRTHGCHRAMGSVRPQGRDMAGFRAAFEAGAVRRVFHSVRTGF